MRGMATHYHDSKATTEQRKKKQKNLNLNQIDIHVL